MKKAYKILLIEPELELANLIISWLENKAYIVHVMDNNLVKELATKDDWHLVIAGINSPEINGWDITCAVKETNSNTALLIVAENIKVDFILHAMQYHADGLFFKPLEKKEFVSRVLELAEESKLKKGHEEKIILAIGAHPDDVELGCAGTLAKLRSDGAHINILTLSLGAAGGIPNIRKKEAKLAAKLQGAKLFLGNLTDTKISSATDTIQFIEGIVQQVKPTHVYTHSFYDSHQDHRNIHQATITACRHTANLFSYLSPSSTVDFRPNIFININQFMDEKLKVLSVFASQGDIRHYLHPDIIKATARYWGRFYEYQLVEPMEVIKEQS